VLRVEPERRRIGLSLRQVSETEWAEWAASYREKHAAQIAEAATITETAEGVRIEEEIVAETADGFVIEEKVTAETADEIVVEDKVVAETAEGVIVVDRVEALTFPLDEDGVLPALIERDEKLEQEIEWEAKQPLEAVTEDRIAVETPEGEVVEGAATVTEPPAEENPSN
jgi:hypothetical protein